MSMATLTYAQAAQLALKQAMQADPTVVALGAELLLQAAVLAEHTAAAEVFTECDDGRIGLHRLLQRELCSLCVSERRNAHRHTPLPLFITCS